MDCVFFFLLRRQPTRSTRTDTLFHYTTPVRSETDFAAMTTFSKDFRQRLAATCAVRRPDVALAQVSKDVTRKWLLRLADGQEVETVYIPEEDRGTLCVPSLVGCTLTCTSCHTGTQSLLRNLAPAASESLSIIASAVFGNLPTDECARTAE